ncbi:MAG: hypothetical protein ACK59A_01050 [Cyanobacteriota bacterium]
MRGLRGILAALGGLLLLLAVVAAPSAVGAGPVVWNEVTPTAEGRQWWDGGSLRLSRQGQLTVLSRFQPAPPTEESGDGQAARPPAGTLYVMELDCDQELYRDISVNGLPRYRAEWQPVAGDSLTQEVLRAACQAEADRLISAAPAPGAEVTGG